MDVKRTPGCVCGKEINPSFAQFPTLIESPPSRATPIPAIPFPSRKTGKTCELHRKTLAFRPPLETSFGAWEGWADGEDYAPGPARGQCGVEPGAGRRADCGSRGRETREEDRGLAGSAGSGSGALARPRSVRLDCPPGWGSGAGPEGGDGRTKGWERTGPRRRDGGSERADE